MKKTQKQSEALAILNARTADFKRNPSGSAWIELTWAMRIYQEAAYNSEGAILTVKQAAADLRENERVDYKSL